MPGGRVVGHTLRVRLPWRRSRRRRASGPRIETSALSDVGRRRDHNEDAWAVFGIGENSGGEDSGGEGSGRLVCVVADGMGGARAGEVASALAVETLRQRLREPSAVEPATTLRTALEQAHAAILDTARADPDKAGMGTTAVCALLDGARAYLANVGDSPAILIGDGGARQLTRDHAWVAEQVAAGEVAPEDAELHPFRHVLTRSLGGEESVEVELYDPFELGPSETLLLCSDGLTEHVRLDELAPLVTAAPTLEAAARALVDLANARGGSDNITVVLARLQA